MAAQDKRQDEDFASMLEASERSGSKGPGTRAVGDLVRGTVVSIGEESVFVDLGGKSEGVLDAAQVLDADGELTVAVGDTLEARVIDAGDSTGVIVLTKTLGKGSEARSELELAFNEGIPVEGLVTGTNKGGFEVQVAGLSAFCPVSQMDARYVEDPEVFVGARHEFRITQFDPRGRNIVLSRRVLLEENAAARAAITRDKLAVDVVFEGTVTRLENYGAFVDIGGIEGMLHISEISFTRLDHPSEVLSVGQQLEVQVIKVENTGDPRRPEKVGLSLKALAKDPWDDIGSVLSVGQRLEGRVVRVEAYGAFVRLDAGVEGLVHISEMGAGERLSSPRKVVEEGQRVEVAVLKIDPRERRIALSMDAARKAGRDAAEREAVEKYAPSRSSLGTLGDLLDAAVKKGK